MSAQDEMLQLDNVHYAGLPDVNVSIGERWSSLLSGVVLFVLGTMRKSLSGSLLALAGAYFLYRGVTGHCFGYQVLGRNTSRRGSRQLPADEPPPPSVEDSDEVVESSWESFPTSDAPSFTAGKRESREG